MKKNDIRYMAVLGILIVLITGVLFTLLQSKQLVYGSITDWLSACGVCWIFPREFLSNRTAVSRLFITAWSWSEYGRVYLLRAAATGDIAILCVSYDQDVYLHYDQQHCSHNHKHGIVLLLDKETKYFATCCIFCFGYFFMCRSHAVSYA